MWRLGFTPLYLTRQMNGRQILAGLCALAALQLARVVVVFAVCMPCKMHDNDMQACAGGYRGHHEEPHDPEAAIRSLWKDLNVVHLRCSDVYTCQGMKG